MDITHRKQPDLNKKFMVTTDASEKCIGAILTQKDTLGREKKSLSYSNTLDMHQLNYPVTEKESTAIVKGLEYLTLLTRETIFTENRS